ncbi:MAG: TIGR03936 family radical SAM-associated protein [Oscillospiraceae bacterium]|nr:TIGR03936 family radical SAM-associated protein [Oscillospiraceae bacterium]
MDKLRLRFEKTGRAVYISHLDLMHTMQRAFSRAGYALKYSEGFNPHPQISIALPLSVGVGSCCELMDFRLNGDAALAELPARLTAAMPEGIRVTDCYVPETKFAALKYLQIEGRFVYDDRPPAEMAAALQTFFCGGSEPIVITKKTKRGVGESDIRPAIRQLRFAPGEEAVCLSAVLSAQEPTLNPALLAEALRQLRPELAPDFESFTRIENYHADLTVFR